MSQNKVLVSLRLPATLVAEVEEHAAQNGCSKTEAFQHFINQGLAAQRDTQVAEHLAEIKAMLKRALPDDAPLPFEQVQQAIQELAAQYPAIRRAYVFGSYARETATAESDIDVRLELFAGMRFDLRAAGRFTQLLEEKLHKSVDLVTARTVKNEALAQAIERDKVLVYECKEK